MRRTGVFVAVLAVTLLVATAGSAARPAVTISLSRPSVVYSGSVSLSGKVSNNKAGETVDVLAEPSGATSFSVLGSADRVTKFVSLRRKKSSRKTSREKQACGSSLPQFTCGKTEPKNGLCRSFGIRGYSR